MKDIIQDSSVTSANQNTAYSTAVLIAKQNKTNCTCSLAKYCMDEVFHKPLLFIVKTPMKCFQDDIIIFIGNGLSLAAISNRYSILTATVCKFPID